MMSGVVANIILRRSSCLSDVTNFQTPVSKAQVRRISFFVIVENEGSEAIGSILLIHNIVRGPLTLC